MAVAHYPTVTPASGDSCSFTESALTASSGSTIWGPGALTGKVLKAFGERGLDFICRVVIYRRLALITKTLEKSPRVLINPTSVKEWQQRNAIYTDLEELCRGHYSLSLRRTAANLLRDIVALITRSVPESFFDGNPYLRFASTRTRLTSLLSTPTHTQWASLFSHLQRHEPLLFKRGGPSITVSKWATAAYTGESTCGDMTNTNGTSVTQYHAKPRGGSQLPDGVSIKIAVTVELEDSRDIRDDYGTTKALAFRTRFFRSLERMSDEKKPGSAQWNGVRPDVKLPEERQRRNLGQGPQVLILGAGGVGKSTLMKHHARALRGWDSSSCSREIIINNVIASMKGILVNMVPFDLSHSMVLMEASRLISELAWSSYDVASFSPRQLEEIGRAICSLWEAPVVRQVIQGRKESLLDDLFITPDSAEYFCNSADRIFSPDYEANFEDALRSRVTTTGIWETLLQSKPFQWRFIDAGGERPERRKWVHFFENATAVLFVVALSDYNRHADEGVNRMDDSLALFDSIVNSPRFANTLIALIFNKTDVFAEELKRFSLNQWVPDYNGETYQDACKYVENRFTDLLKDKNRPLCIYYTCAVNEQEMLDISTALRDEITRHYEQRVSEHKKYRTSNAGSLDHLASAEENRGPASPPEPQKAHVKTNSSFLCF